jgi:peptidoglycan-N-acetylmuramic acid deacetylase
MKYGLDGISQKEERVNRRIGCVILLVMVVLWLTGCKSGILQNDSKKLQGETTQEKEKEESSEAGLEDPEASEEESSDQTSVENGTTEAEDPHKVVNYDEISNTKYAWWFKRNETNSQPEAQEEVDISQYDAWYLDPGQTEKVVYLTFDCGYENGFTPSMLDTLKKHNAKAVFFITKHFAKDAADIVKRMKEEGHYVGNHTASHPDLTAMDTRSIKLELEECAEAMKENTGYEMDPFFRPPKGEYSERVLKIAQDMGYKTLFWSLAYVDYDVNNQPGADYVIDHFQKYIHPGAMPLIHNVSESNAQALDQVLTDLENKGYRFGDAAEIGEKK